MSTNPKHKKENTRIWLAKAITIGFGITLILFLIAPYFDIDMSALSFLFSGVTGIFGMVIGYYFNPKI